MVNCENVKCNCLGMSLFIHRNVQVEEDIELRIQNQSVNTDEIV